MNIEQEIPGHQQEADELQQPKGFPVGALPPVLEEMATAMANVLHIPVDLTGPLVLATASAAIGKGCQVRSFKENVTAGNLFMLFVANSGVGKSSAFRLASAPIFGRQALLKREFEETVKPSLQTEHDVASAEVETLKRSLKDKSGEERQETIQAMKEARVKLAALERKLKHPLLITNDSTSEGMAKLLSENGETLWHCDQDAGDAVASILSRYSESGGTQESLWLKAYSGEPHFITRKNADPIVLSSPRLTLTFIMTPDLAGKLFANDRLAQGGFLARCLVCNPRVKAREITVEEARESRAIPSAISQAYEAAMFGALETYRLGDFCENPPTIGLTDAALELLVEDSNAIVRAVDGDHDPFSSRQVEQAVRISLVIHLFNRIVVEQKETPGTYGCRSITGHEEPIPKEVMRAAIMIRDWFRDHQAGFLAPQREGVIEAKWDKARRMLLSIPNGITARNLYNGRAVAKDKKEAEELLGRWTAEGRLVPFQPEKKGGRGAPPPTHYKLPPLSRMAA